MICCMREEAWLNQDHQFLPGQELFRSDRSFAVWAYTVSHSQLLLRTRQQPRVELLFKPVDAIKIRTDYDGLIIRCATVEEHEEILGSTGEVRAICRVLILETGGLPDYVVTGAFGWKQDAGHFADPSALAFFAPATDPSRILP
jgi:hypothetical protein